jgi:hypothetical protein
MQNDANNGILRVSELVTGYGKKQVVNGVTLGAAHLPVGGELAGLSEPFQARSCGCTQHNVFRAVW